MLTQILKDLRLIEGKSISKKAGFKYFFIQEVEDVDAILNTEDLADKSSVSILLFTEKNFQKQKVTKKDAYTVKTSDLFKYMERTVPDFKKDDYIDFTGGYSLSALIGNYIQDEFDLTWCRRYEDLQRVMDIQYEDEFIKNSI